MDHEYMVEISSSVEVYFRRVVVAVKIYIIAIPISTMTVGVTFLNIENNMIIADGINANMNALIIIPKLLESPGIIVNPNTTNNVTPNNAPDEIPVVYESVRGFLIIVCITAPPIPRIPPTNIPAIALGVSPSHTM